MRKFSDAEDAELLEQLEPKSQEEWLEWLVSQEPGRMIHGMRVLAGLTRTEAAKLAQIDSTYLGRIEQMRRVDLGVHNPSRDVLLAIRDALGVLPSEFDIVLEAFDYAGSAHTRHRHDFQRHASDSASDFEHGEGPSDPPTPGGL